MKKLLLILCFFLCSISSIAQNWKPNNPDGLIYSNKDITLILTKNYFHIDGLIFVDVVLYDSLGHFIRDWKRLDLDTKEEEIAYRIIYEHVTKENGWIRLNGKDIPTKRKEDEEN